MDLTAHSVYEQWSTRNNVNPNKISSKQKVWWVCDKGHEWETTVASRVYNKTNCPYCANLKIAPGFNDFVTTHPAVAAQWDYTKNVTIDPAHIFSTTNEKVWWVCDKGHEWKATVRGRVKNPEGNCLQCLQDPKDVKSSLLSRHPELACYWDSENEIKPETLNYKEVLVSEAEKNINSWINSSLGLTTLTNSRTVLKNLQELDIYVPEKKLAIEFNGLYWHDENHKPRNYHYDKWLACKNQGIQLIQVWEDDWKTNPELIKQMLAHKLGVTVQKKIYARNTTVVTVPLKESTIFLKENHIQGAITGGLHIGLQYEGSLVAVMILKQEKKGLSLLRYATSKTVVGGFTKLVAHLEKTYEPESIVTFSDNTVSDGNLYESNGFTATKAVSPDYMYVVQRTRIHKFGYRLKRFRNDPNLDYIEGLSEKQLAELNNIPRIWDAGKIKWEKVRIN